MYYIAVKYIYIVKHDDGLQKRNSLVKVGTIVNLFVREARLLHEGTGWCFTSLSMKDERKLIKVFYIQLSLVKMFYLNFNRKS